VHDRLWVHLDDGFRGWWAVAQSTVWSFCVVLFPPLFDQGLSFSQAVEDFAVQELIPEPGVKAFAVSVLPWTTWSDVRGLRANGLDPILDGLSNKLWAIV
jgi:hypothetical protein